MGQGIEDKFAHQTGNFEWWNKAVNYADAGKIYQKKKYRPKTTSGVNILKEKGGGSSTEIKPNRAVDGIRLYNYLKDHQGVLTTYMNKEMVKLNVIAKITTIHQKPTSEGVKVDPVTKGLPHLDWPMFQSRSFAVASGRASIRYPVAEVGGILIKNREAQSVGDLLLAGDEILDPLAKLLLTGNVKYKVKPAWGEYGIAEGTLRANEIYKAFIESENETDTFKEQLDELFDIYPELDPNIMFPMDPNLHYEPTGKRFHRGRFRLSDEGTKVREDRNNYIDMLYKSFNDGLREDEQETLREWIQRATQ